VWKKRLVWTLVIIGGIFFSLWAVSATVDLTIWGAYTHFIDTLSDRLAINRYLANALSFLFVAPFFVGVRYYLFSLRDRQRKQRIGLAILLSMGVIYNLALYYGTRNQNFGPNGPVKFYALVPGGVVFSDRAGIEPIYGVPFRRVSPENIKWLIRIQQGRIGLVSDPAHHDWFDLVTGDPLLWYSTDSAGNFRFFDGPGHDPATRADLKPVTPDTQKEWEKKIGAAAESHAQGVTSAEPAGDVGATVETPSAALGKGRVPTESGTEDAHPETPIRETYQRVFSDDFLFELQSCVLRGKNLTCYFTVTNDLDSDRTLGLKIYWGSCSRIFDGEGNEYISKSGQLGSDSGTPGISGLGNTLIPGIKTKAALEFEGVSPQVKLAKVLRVVFTAPHGSQEYLNADFTMYQFKQDKSGTVISACDDQPETNFRLG